MTAEDVGIIKQSESKHLAELPAAKLEQIRMHREEIRTRLARRNSWRLRNAAARSGCTDRGV